MVTWIKWWDFKQPSQLWRLEGNPKSSKKVHSSSLNLFSQIIGSSIPEQLQKIYKYHETVIMEPPCCLVTSRNALFNRHAMHASQAFIAPRAHRKGCAMWAHGVIVAKSCHLRHVFSGYGNQTNIARKWNRVVGERIREKSELRTHTWSMDMDRDSNRKAREAFLIQKGRTIDPDGLNIREETY